MVPVSNGESISTAFAWVPQESTGLHFEFFFRPHTVHRMPTVIRMSQRLSTGFCTIYPQFIHKSPGVIGNAPQSTEAWHGCDNVPVLLGTVPHRCGALPPAGRDQQPAGSGWPALALASSAGNWPSAWAMAIASWYSRHPVICPSGTRSIPMKQPPRGGRWWSRFRRAPPVLRSAASCPAGRTGTTAPPPARGARTARFHNAPVNTIALSCATTYHGYMTTWQMLKRAGYLNPISQPGAAQKSGAALIGGVVAV